MKHLPFILLCFSSFLCFTSQDLQAGLVSFSNRAAFSAGLTTSQNIDFEGTFGGTFENFSTASGYNSNGVNFVGNFPSSGNPYYLFRTDADVGSYLPGQLGPSATDGMLGEGRGDITMTFAGGVNSVGLDFTATEMALGANVGFTFAVNGADSFTAIGTARSYDFFGVVSDAPITSFSVRTTSVTRPPQLMIDNVLFGFTPVAVPEPGTLAMFLTGMGALSFRRRK